jgi:hypothetical protein
MDEPTAAQRPLEGPKPLLPADDAFWLDCVGKAVRETSPMKQAERLLPYLESFPLGAHNRDMAERVEALLDRLEDGPEKRALVLRLRGARDRYLPAVESSAG